LWTEDTKVEVDTLNRVAATKLDIRSSARAGSDSHCDIKVKMHRVTMAGSLRRPARPLPKRAETTTSSVEEADATGVAVGGTLRNE
jgi:hypothetical protein